jgi:hypothetical protein
MKTSAKIMREVMNDMIINHCSLLRSEKSVETVILLLPYCRCIEILVGTGGVNFFEGANDFFGVVPWWKSFLGMRTPKKICP